jgi:hypothetical protein
MRSIVLALLLVSLGLTTAHAAPLIPLDSPPQPTGDVLWDKYAQAVWAGLHQPDARPTQFAALISTDEVATWSDLISDPRSWQLRLWLDSVTAQAIDEVEYKDEGARAWQHIIKAKTWDTVIEGRHETTLTTLLYGLDLHEKIEVGLGRQEKIAPPALDRARDHWFYTYEKVADEGRLWDKCKTEFPESAWPNYLKALYYEQLGEYDLGLAQIAAGNELNDVALPALFPCNVATTMLADDILGKHRPDTGNLVVALAVKDAMTLERLPSVLGQITDEVGADPGGYPLYQLADYALDSGDAAQVQQLGLFAQRVLAARPYDSRLGVVGLGAAAALLANAEEAWDLAAQPPRETPLIDYSWLDLPNVLALSTNAQRQRIFSSYPAADLEWLYQQRFVKGKVELAQWEPRLNAYVGKPAYEFPNPGDVVAEWSFGVTPDEQHASPADTVALLGALAQALRQAETDIAYPQVIERLKAQDWAKLLPPPAE